MKKLLLIFVILIKSNFGYSQILQNTVWTVYDPTNVFVSFARFDGAILAFSGDNVSYTDIASYQENGNNFKIVDLAGTSTCYDTGNYSLLVTPDTLIFTAINDPCTATGREPFLTTYFWVRLTTGIHENNSVNEQVSIYPNPFQEQATIKFPQTQNNVTIQIRDIYGKEIKTTLFSGKQYTIEKEEMKSGIYFVQIIDEKKNTIIKKVIVQ
jgi:hypothetical protein